MVSLPVSLQSAPRANGEPITPISIKENENYHIGLEAAEEEQSLWIEEEQSQTLFSSEGRQGYHPLPEPVIDSPNSLIIGSPSTDVGSPDIKVGLPDIKVGDRVANADPYKESSLWIGEVMKIIGTDFLVQWKEGEGLRLLTAQRYQRSELRRV